MIQRPNFKRYIIGADDAALAGAAATVIAGGTSAVAQSSMNKKTREFNREEAEKQRAWSEKMYNAQNQWNLDMWNLKNEYDAPAAQMERLKAAGLNPLYYGLDGNASGAMQAAAQPLGYERAKADNQVNPVSVGLDTLAKMKELDNSSKLANAQIDKMNAETGGLKLDNEFKEKTMEARTEGVELANNLTKEQIGKVKQEIEESKKRVDKLIEETKSEIERQGLIAAQTALTKAEEKEIVELLPFKKNLMAAQTAAQKAAAAASYVHAMYEKGLIDSGYIDKMCEHLAAQTKNENASANQKEVQNAINEWKLAVKNGNVYDIDSIPWSRPTDKVAAYLCNGLFQFASAASEAVGGGLAGFF